MKWRLVLVVCFIAASISSTAVADEAFLVAEEEFSLADDGSTIAQLLIAGRYDSWVDGSLYSYSRAEHPSNTVVLLRSTRRLTYELAMSEMQAMGYAPAGLTELLMYERQTLSSDMTFALGLVYQTPFRMALCVRKDGIGRRTIGFESMSEGLPKGSRFLAVRSAASAVRLPSEVR